MKTHYYQHNGKMFKEFTYKSWARLNELKEIFEKTGSRCWLNLYDGIAGTWILTVEESRP